MKLNLGCGMNKRAGYVNVDKFPHGEPDLVFDLEVTPWPFDANSVERVLMHHVLEHLGQDSEVFFGIIKELHRVCKAGAEIEINVPHPRHDNFINDPTHVRIITPQLLGMFSKSKCLRWKEKGVPNTPLALYLDVDFELESTNVIVDQIYIDQVNSGQITEQRLYEMVEQNNNVAAEYRMVLKAIKPAG